MSIIHQSLILGFWGVWFLYWAISSRNVKKAERAETFASRAFHLGFIMVALCLIGLKSLNIGFLSWRVLPASALVFWTGMGILILGLAFSVWARAYLGRNWSGMVTIKSDHRLIRNGPYAIVRHPIYTGIVFGVLGTAISQGQLKSFLALLIIFAAFLRKLSLEEKYLAGHFGGEYQQFQKEVKALIPFVI